MSSFPTRTALAGLGLMLGCTLAHAGFVFTFEKQGAKPDFNSAPPPALSGPMQAAIAGYGSNVTKTGGNEFETGATAFTFTGGNALVSSGTPSVIDGNTQAPSDRQLGRYNTTTGLPLYNDPNEGPLPNRGHWLEASSTFFYDFGVGAGLSALSFFGTDFGDFEGQLIIDLYKAGSATAFDSLVVPSAQDPDVNGLLNRPVNGNLIFFGLRGTVTGDTFDRVGFRIVQGTGPVDVLGIDSLSVGKANLTSPALPEPGTLALVPLSLGLLALSRRRR